MILTWIDQYVNQGLLFRVTVNVLDADRCDKWNKSNSWDRSTTKTANEWMNQQESTRYISSHYNPWIIIRWTLWEMNTQPTVRRSNEWRLEKQNWIRIWRTLYELSRSVSFNYSHLIKRWTLLRVNRNENWSRKRILNVLWIWMNTQSARKKADCE